MRLSRLVEAINKRENFPYRAADESFQLIPFFSGGNVKGYQVILRITNQCNMNCGFCFVDKQKSSFSDEDTLKIIRGLLSSDFSSIDFDFVISGGEPTLHKHFFQILEFMENSGINRISVQTNATIFSDFQNVLKLPQEKNILSFFVSFCSHKQDTFNKITSSELFYDAVNGIKNLLQNFPVALNIVVTKQNYLGLESMVDFFEKKFDTRNLSLKISNIGILPEKDMTSYLEDYQIIRPHISRLLDQASRAGIDANFTFSGACSFPLCVLRKFSKKYFSMRVEEICFFKAEPNLISVNSLKRQFYKSEKCSSCKFNFYCQGFTSHYISVFGYKDIDPIVD